MCMTCSGVDFLSWLQWKPGISYALGWFLPVWSGVIPSCLKFLGCHVFGFLLDTRSRLGLLAGLSALLPQSIMHRTYKPQGFVFQVLHQTFFSLPSVYFNGGALCEYPTGHAWLTVYSVDAVHLNVKEGVWLAGLLAHVKVVQRSTCKQGFVGLSPASGTHFPP